VPTNRARQESLAIAEGLKRQRAGLLDELIVRYQHRLAALSALSHRQTTTPPEDLFQEVWMRVLLHWRPGSTAARF